MVNERRPIMKDPLCMEERIAAILTLSDCKFEISKFPIPNAAYHIKFLEMECLINNKLMKLLYKPISCKEIKTIHRDSKEILHAIISL